MSSCKRSNYCPDEYDKMLFGNHVLDINRKYDHIRPNKHLGNNYPLGLFVKKLHPKIKVFIIIMFLYKDSLQK